MTKTEIGKTFTLQDAVELVEANGGFLSPVQQNAWCMPEMALLRFPGDEGKQVPVFQFRNRKPVSIVLAVQLFLVVNLRDVDEIVRATMWWFTPNKLLNNERPVDLIEGSNNVLLLSAARAKTPLRLPRELN